jgi:hypothetical protein
MKKKYYVSEVAQDNGDHEVHEATCVYLPNSNNRKLLGEFDSCQDAVRAAKSHHNQVNGCYYCSNACHTS